MLTRRRFSLALAAGLPAAPLAALSPVARAAPRGLAGIASDLARIERECGGRLGAAVIDTATGTSAGHRAGERFPLCSTFKLLAAAAVLKRVDDGAERLDRVVRFSTGDLVTYSPVTQARVEAGMTLAEICEAAMTLSDNTAGNLLLAAIGGPAGLTAYVRSLGDGVTRLDRIETALNEARPGDPRDTTTPAAMAADLRRLVLEDALSPRSRDLLAQWLVGNRTGATRLRAGVPAGWRVGDKTGAGANGTANDVGVIWPPGRAPVLVAVYITGSRGTDAQRHAAIAAVARATAQSLAG